MSVHNLFSKYVKNSKYKQNIKVCRIFLLTPNKKIQKVLNSGKATQKIFITTKSLKHVYDRHIFEKKIPSDFYSIIRHLESILTAPDRIYIDKKEKRGDFIFVKEINSTIYMCALEIQSETEIEIVSACITGEKYLRKFALLWS